LVDVGSGAPWLVSSEVAVRAPPPVPLCATPNATPRRIWTCDVCGKRETWRRGWGYYFTESVANVREDGAPLPWAMCSEACEDAYGVATFGCV
jgi:hypothetical protein